MDKANAPGRPKRVLPGALSAFCKTGHHDLCKEVFLAHINDKFVKARCECRHHWEEKAKNGRTP